MIMMTSKLTTMSKDIKDYLHLYLGCEVTDITINKKGNKFILDANNFPYVFSLITEKKGKLLLRPLSDITEEERHEWLDFRLNDKIEPELSLQLCEAERTKFLLSKGFDLFNLIPEGLAIDKTRL